MIQVLFHADCPLCANGGWGKTSVQQDTAEKARRQAGKFSWEPLTLPYKLELWLCAFHKEPRFRRQVLEAIMASAQAQVAALPPEPPEPPAAPTETTHPMT